MHLCGTGQWKSASAVCCPSQAVLFRHRVPCIGVAPACLQRRRAGGIYSTPSSNSSHSHGSSPSPTWEQVKQAANLCQNMPVAPGSPGRQSSPSSQFSAATSNMHTGIPHRKAGSPAPCVRMSAMGHVYEPHGDPEDDELIWMREELTNQAHEQHFDGDSVEIDPDAAERLIEHERLRRALRLIRNPLAQMTPSPSRQKSPTIPPSAIPPSADVDVTRAGLGLSALKRQSPSLRDIQVHTPSSYPPTTIDESLFTKPAQAQAMKQHDRQDTASTLPQAAERRPDIPVMDLKSSQEVAQSGRIYGAAVSQQASSELLDLDSPGSDTVSWEMMQGGQQPDNVTAVMPSTPAEGGRQWSGQPCILRSEAGIVDRTADFGDPEDINMVMSQMHAEELPAGQSMVEDAADLNGAVGLRS